MATSICPDREDLRSFHLGMLDERRELEVFDHLNDCQSCEDTVATLEGTADSLVVAVRGSVSSGEDASGSGHEEDRPALQQALAEIEELIDSPPAADSSQQTAPPVTVSERIRDYELLGTLGEGGMGTVYRARHTRLDRQVALKLLPARRLRDNAAIARFEREMKAIGRLDHPAIVRATDAGDVDGTHFLAMDYVEGIDLSKLVRLVGPLDVASACEIVRQAAIGLDYAHRQELIHRDVKPSNLMLTLRGEVRILDLGLALFGAASEALDELTTVGQLMGTLDYMAPEQGDNSHDVDARSDVYSLGATLFKLLTATAPYDSPGTRTPLAKMKALATIDAPSVAERRPELPGQLVTIVDRVLLRNADDRFASAKELADSLLPFCEGHVLSDLAECGHDLALREDQDIAQPPTLPPFVQRAEKSDSPANVTPAAEISGRPPEIGHRIAKWMLVPLILLTGIVIWIQTDNGTLIVESPSGDIPIEIRTGGKFHRNETLSVGKNELTIHSGTYEIVLPKEYDSLTVENHVFSLERGGKWIARISKKDEVDPPDEPDKNFADVTKQALIGSFPTLPGAVPGLRAAQPGSSPEGGMPGASGFPPSQPGIATVPIPKVTKNSETLVFSGKTFEEWQRSVLTERNPVELRKAVEALCILGRQNRDAEVASTVLKVVDAYPCEINRGGSESELIVAAIRYLRTLTPASIAPAVAIAARTGGVNTRTLILEFLIAGKDYPPGSAANTLQNLGQGEALATNLKRSVEIRDSLIAVFPELEPENRTRAFSTIFEHLKEDHSDSRLIEFLDNCSRHENPGRIELVAARRLTDVKPSARLADVFLTYLENQNGEQRVKKLRSGGFFAPAVPDWWSFESDAWLGLAALGKLASGSAGRIAKLIDNVPDSLAKPQTIYLMASPSRVKTRFEIHRQLLPIEILAMIGSRAKSTVPTINNVLKTLTGSAPTPQGDYGFDGFHEKLVLERIIGQDFRTGVPSPEALTADVEQIRDRPQRLDSALVAVRRITGQAARFELDEINANGARKAPTGMSAGHPGGAMGSGYPGGGPAGMMEDYGGGDEYGQGTSEKHSPRLVTYKGKSFAEWADTTKNFGSGTPLFELQRRMQEVFRGVSLLAQTPEERKAAATLAIMVFDYTIRRSRELTPELQKLLVETIEFTSSNSSGEIFTPIEDALAQVSPTRRAFLLSGLLVPVEESNSGFRLQERSFTRKVIRSSPFALPYNELVANWDEQPMELQNAILQVEAHLPALGQKNSTKLLTRRVREAYESATSDTETEAPINDQSMKVAFILAATEPKDDDVQSQLEVLLARVLAKPHVLRRSRQAEATTRTESSVEEKVRPATMRPLDADRLHAAIGLKLACGDSLSEETARRFGELIVQDTERHEVGSFRIVSPSNVATSGGLSSAVGGMDEYSDEGIAGYAQSGSGYPGMTGGYAQFGGGYPGMPVIPVGSASAETRGMTEGNYLEGALIWNKNQRFSADHGEFSRRLLMIRLLQECPPEDEAAKNEIGEQLAATLLKAYPKGFLPAPHDENQNVSVYDLIETEFRSGVRFRKLPTKGDKDLETARFLDTASGVVWNYLPDDRRMQLHQNRVAELQAAQVAATKPKQLYDGRPFEEWLAVVNTERSPERLSEAVTALTILGKTGRDTEAAYALLKCLAPFPVNSRGQKTPEGRLVNTIDHRFWQLDRKATAPVAADLIENGNSSQRTFLLVHNHRHISNWIQPGGLLANPQFVKTLLEATQDDDSEVRWQASAFLIPMLLTGEVKLTSETLDQVTVRLKSLLTDPRAKTPAAVCLAQLAPETPSLTEVLLAEIDQFVATNGNGPIYAKVSRDNHDSLQFSDAYWALRKLIVHHKTTPEELQSRLLELLQIRREGEPGRIFEVDYYRFDHRTLIAELLVSGTPPSDDSRATIRIALEKIVTVETEWANRRAKNTAVTPAPLGAAPASSESATETEFPITTAYTPILTGDYFFPLPSSLRYPSDSAWDNKERNQHADELRAAKWALQQLEKSSPPEEADE